MQAAAAASSTMEESNAINVEQLSNHVNNLAVSNEHDEQQQSLVGDVTEVAASSSNINAVASSSTTTTTNGNASATPADFSYDALFPALPSSNASSTPAWGPREGGPPSIARVVPQQKTHILQLERDECRMEWDKFGEGELKRICQQIMRESGAQIEMARTKAHAFIFLLKGKQNELNQARRKIILHFSTQVNKSLTVPKEHHRIILGKRGERLQELERVTDTRINIPKLHEDSDVITISGPREGIEKAEEEILRLSEEQYKKSSDRIAIPKIYHPFIVGANNEQLNAICAETGAKVNVPPQQVQKDEIIIFGEKNAVAAAKARVEAIYKEMEKKCTTVSVEVAKAQHRYIIGPRGSTIADILRATGVSVEMPPSDSPSETITLRGPPQDLGNALTAVYQKANSVKTVDLQAPRWIHKYIIGRKGANMRQLEEDYPNVNYNCVDDTIKLEGEPESVDKAAAYLNDIVRNYVENYAYVVMQVNPSHYKHIIGKAGANVNRLKEELNVHINIEEQPGQNNIRIEGPKEGVQQAQLELQEKIDKLDNEKTRDAVIDRRLHRSIIGARGEKIRDLKDRYRQVNITIPTPQENTDNIKLRGPKDDVDKCYKDLMKLVKDLQESSHIIEVPIFKQFHKNIIGKGGANIKKIRDETQTNIDLPAEGDNNEVIVITGRRENVLEAKERIQKIQEECADIVTEELTIAPKYYNSLIGTRGKLISSIMNECGGVSIKFPNSDSKSDCVVIRGPKEDVERAKTQLLELVNEREQASFTAEVTAKQQHHRFLIGRNGGSIKKIREATGVRIIFPSHDDENKELITIIGREDGVQAAKQQLETLIKEIDEVVEDEMIVEPMHHKHFVVRRGEILHRISEDCGGVSISFPRPGVDSDRVSIKGPKECVEAAKQRIAEIVEDLEAQETILVYIPQRLHRTLMGPRGSRVQQVTTEWDVQIKFPDRDAIEPVHDGGMQENGVADENNGGGDELSRIEIIDGVGVDDEPIRHCDVIRISGRMEKCQGAKQALADLIPVTEEINVPFDLHRLIIGPRGSNVRQFKNNYDVHVDLPPSEEQSDIIRITGTLACIAEAKEGLNKMLEEFEAERADRELRSYALELEVEPKFHSKIIGRKGAVINKLRADHDVNISLPKRHDEEQRIITITGYQQNVESARDAILEIVGELQTLTSETIEIDSRIHSRIIGHRGRAIRKIIDDHKVDIQFPGNDAENPNAVTIIGKEENVEDVRELLYGLAEDYEREFLDDEQPARAQIPTVAAFFPGAVQQQQANNGNDSEHVGGAAAAAGASGAGHAAGTASKENGFVIKNAPWERKPQNAPNNTTAPNTLSQTEFPEFARGGPANATPAPLSSAWGPRH